MCQSWLMNLGLVTQDIVYSGSGLERAAALRRDAARLAGLAGDEAARLIPMWRGKNLVAIEGGPRAVLLPAAALREAMAAARETSFLGLLDGAPLFASDITNLSEGRQPPALGEGTQFVNLREVGPNLAAREASLLAYARGLLHWHAQHRFCPACGQPTQSEEGGHMRRCADKACNTLHFPRTDPAVIMLVHDGERCLLARQPRFPAGMYSTLAGFVEPGETLEEAVIREVAEEAGIPVTEVRYAGSQPWPFPASLMLGFYARATASAITLDPHELEDARWLSRAELRDSAKLGIHLPRGDSIARRLVEGWLGAGA
jgi:NAD+ diphosphatase